MQTLAAGEGWRVEQGAALYCLLGPEIPRILFGTNIHLSEIH